MQSVHFACRQPIRLSVNTTPTADYTLDVALYASTSGCDRLLARARARTSFYVRACVYFARNPTTLDTPRSLSGVAQDHESFRAYTYTAVAEISRPTMYSNSISLSYNRDAYVRASRVYKGHCAPTAAAAPPAAPHGVRLY